jgi:hypothetical protein
MDTDLCNLGTGGYGSTVYSSLVLFRKNKQSGYKRGRKFVLRNNILRPGFTCVSLSLSERNGYGYGKGTERNGNGNGLRETGFIG